MDDRDPHLAEDVECVNLQFIDGHRVGIVSKGRPMQVPDRSTVPALDDWDF